MPGDLDQTRRRKRSLIHNSLLPSFSISLSLSNNTHNPPPPLISLSFSLSISLYLHERKRREKNSQLNLISCEEHPSFFGLLLLPLLLSNIKSMLTSNWCYMWHKQRNTLPFLPHTYKQKAKKIQSWKTRKYKHLYGCDIIVDADCHSVCKMVEISIYALPPKRYIIGRFLHEMNE